MNLFTVSRKGTAVESILPGLYGGVKIDNETFNSYRPTLFVINKNNTIKKKKFFKTIEITETRTVDSFIIWAHQFHTVADALVNVYPPEFDFVIETKSGYSKREDVELALKSGYRQYLWTQGIDLSNVVWDYMEDDGHESLLPYIQNKVEVIDNIDLVRYHNEVQIIPNMEIVDFLIGEGVNKQVLSNLWA